LLGRLFLLLRLELTQLTLGRFATLIGLSLELRNASLPLLIAHLVELSYRRYRRYAVRIGSNHLFSAVLDLEFPFGLVLRYRLDLQSLRYIRCNRRRHRLLSQHYWTCNGLLNFNRYLHRRPCRFDCRRKLSDHRHRHRL
jgi:hypothetical protein